MNEKIVLAYSGGLDTSVAIHWLKEQCNYDVVAVFVDVGESKDINFIQQKALQIGASHVYIIDAKKEYAQRFILPALQANALYEGIYPLISALSRPLIAEALVNTANSVGAVAVAHGCTGKGNDQVRFEVSINALNPKLKIIAPARINPISREQAIEYAKKNDIPLPINLENPFSIDQNLWGRSCECGVLEDPWVEPPEAAFDLTQSINNAPVAAEEIIIEFEKGIPVALNGNKMSLVELIENLNVVAGKHGVGRIDHIENRLIGIKSREVYEAPAAITLITAHRALEAITLPKEILHFKPMIEQQFAHLIYQGLWFSPLNNALYAFIKDTQQYVNGHVRIKLHKGNIIVSGRKSTTSLYNLDLATYKENDQFDHQAAEGFIKLWGLSTKIFSMVNTQQETTPQEETYVK